MQIIKFFNKELYKFFLLFLYLFSSHLAAQNKEVSLVQTLSYTQSICEESAKDIKGNWLSEEEYYKTARQLFNSVKAETDSWINEIQFRLQANTSFKITVPKAKYIQNINPIIAAENKFMAHYHSCKNTNNRSLEEVNNRVTRKGKKAVFFEKLIKKNIQKLSESQKKVLSDKLEGLRLQSWDDIAYVSPPACQPAKLKPIFFGQTEKVGLQLQGNISHTLFSNQLFKQATSSFNSAFKTKKEAQATTKPLAIHQKQIDLSLTIPTFKGEDLKEVNENILFSKILLEYYIQKNENQSVSLSYEYLDQFIETKNNSFLMNIYLEDVLDFLQEKGAINQQDWSFLTHKNEGVELENLKKYYISGQEVIYDKYKNAKKLLVSKIKQEIKSETPLISKITLFHNQNTDNQDFIIKEKGDVSYQYLQTILIVGFDDTKKLFKFRNVKDAEWGENGYGYITYEYAEDHLRALYKMNYDPASISQSDTMTAGAIVGSPQK